MKSWYLLVLEGVGAALLILFNQFWLLLLPLNISLYHYALPITNLLGGILVDILGVAILTTGFLIAIQYLPPTLQRTLNALFFGVLLWRIVDMAILVQTNLTVTRFWSGIRVQTFLGILLLSGVLAVFLPYISKPAVHAIRLVMAAFAFCGIWIIPKLLYLTLEHQPVEDAAFNHLPPASHSTASQRIIWILYDELSYDQAFDHPAADISLPNLDRIRAESVSFSNLTPAGYLTDHIIPSLFLGRRINEIRGRLDGELQYKDESQHRWLDYDASATLFGLAQQNGWTTGVVGWSNPYCRILAPVLNICAWQTSRYMHLEDYGASEDKSVLANAAVLPSSLLSRLMNPRKASVDPFLQQYRNVMARTHALIENDQVRFVFVHLPIPHPPGIYDRQRHLLRSGGTYLDNLVLVDDSLGELLQEIDGTLSANQTTVIISSDHSWRIPTWIHTKSWGVEEAAASGGRFDERPVLLIHFPGQKTGNDIQAGLPELLEHDMIADILLGRLKNSDELSTFVSKHGS